MSIWKKINIGLDELNQLSHNTLAQVLDIRFSRIGDHFLEASMPVGPKVHQPYGILHGGASAALAETVGSVASSLCIDTDKQICVGLEINCNHIKAKRDGIITATAQPLHLGATTHVWDIKISDEKGKLVCVSRLTMAILKKR